MRYFALIAALLIAATVMAGTTKTFVIEGGIYRGARDDAGEHFYQVESEGRLYEIEQHGHKNPLEHYAPGDDVIFHIDPFNGWFYVILPDKKHGMSRDVRYRLVHDFPAGIQL